MKRNAPAFSNQQEPVVAEVLQLRAAEKNAPLKFTDVDPTLPKRRQLYSQMSKGEMPRSAAVLLTPFLRLEAPGSQNLVAQDILRGIRHFSWPGRFQKIVDGNYQWFLDIAHNEMSLLVAAQWFAQQVSRYSFDKQFNSNDLHSNVPSPTRTLVFTHTSGRSSGRGDRTLMKSIANPLQARGIRFDDVNITTLKERQSGAKRIGMAASLP
jgi:folylpolyglutamate synthase